MTTTKERYKEFKPAPILQPYLVCFWSYFSESPSVSLSSKSIIPDGCIDIIFDLNRPAITNSFVVGAMTKSITSNRTNLTGIRFKPGMAHPFLKCPMNELTDMMIDFREFVGNEANHVLDQLANLHTIEKQVSILNKVFIQKLSTLWPVEAPMTSALNLIYLTGGNCTVTEISRKIGWSRQHFTRKCISYTGLNPKFLSQVIRIKKLIELHKFGQFRNWSTLSLDADFYDQSHMINEFKKITGFTPLEYCK